MFYELYPDGRISGRYAVQQAGKILHLLDKPPDGGSWMRDGVPGTKWIIDVTAIATAEAEALRIQQKNQAIIDNLPSRAQVRAAILAISNLAEAKAFIGKLTEVVYWLAKNSEA